MIGVYNLAWTPALADQSELVKLFTEHYKTHHPCLSAPTFTQLVVNNEVKFVVEANCLEAMWQPRS